MQTSIPATDSFGNELSKRIQRAAACAVAALLLPVAAWGQTACPETNGVKIEFPPQTTYGGLDVRDSRKGLVLADDFPCTSAGKITDIHLWGSWSNNVHGLITNFWLGIYDDIPAYTNYQTGIAYPSHPGTNLLWQQSFPAGQFYETQVYTNAYEYFYDPSTGTPNVYPETNLWYYCFYPTNPFVQQGSINQPTNYWLAVRTQLTNDGTLHGWKTTTINYNDAAVWGTSGANGLPLGDWTPLTNPVTQQPVNLSFKLTTQTNATQTNCCPEVSGLKWIQWPNLFSAFDINVSTVPGNSGPTVADDFGCNVTGPISDIRIWGSWWNDFVDPGATFILSIWSDVPSAPAGGYSQPGSPLWTQAFSPGQGPGHYGMCHATNTQENFYTANSTGSLILSGSSQNLYYLCFTPYATNIFTQTGNAAAPTNYWLSVSVLTESAAFEFGWKTSATNYNDTAVVGSGVYPGFWSPMYDPTYTGSPVNMAFKINTSTNLPQQCVETNTVKYVQWPNVSYGADIWDSSPHPVEVPPTEGPWVLADDFVCTNSGKISDIHLWGSWEYDSYLTNSITFEMYVLNDVPTNAANPFSHPGTNVIWHQKFIPGQYVEQVWTTNAYEYFVDPGPPAILGQDFKVWYYCFAPSNLVQNGTVTAPRTYWLAVFAELPSGATNVFGWKTTTYVSNDISVHAPWLGAAPTNQSLWTPTSSPNTGPVDLSFKICTTTNCPLNVSCPSDFSVYCTNAWDFGAPTIDSRCCGTNYSVTVSTITNGACNRIATRTWQIVDCLGQTYVCMQSVSIIPDGNPPVITCATNKTVPCGSNWTFDPPGVVDSCFGTNVTLTLLSTNLVSSSACTNVWSAIWRAKDPCGNASTCTQFVTVVVTNSPQIICPSIVTATTCDTNPVQVFWTVSATNVCTSFTIVSSPTNGSFFRTNSTNLVTCWAFDLCGHSNSCTFYVVVGRPVMGPMTITWSAPNITIHWTAGILQQADNVFGPWTDVGGASPPSYTVAAAAAARFYRLRCTSP